jgi:hypothetical protein
MRFKLMALMILGLLGVLTAGQVRAASTVKLYFDNANISMNTGEVKTVKLMADSGTTYLSGLDIALTFNSMVKVNKVTMNGTNFSVVQKATVEGGKVMLTGYNSNKYTNQLPKGVFEIVTLEMQGLSQGQASLTLTNSQVVGNDGSTPTYFTVNYEKPTITVGTAVVSNGTDGVLKFKVAFSGVTAGSTCAKSWPVSVLVRWGDQSKVFGNVPLTVVGNVAGKQVYKGEVLLSGVPDKKNLAVFVKGPKHIQMKYGKNGQGDFYNKAGGEVAVDADPNKTPVNDFSGYPMLAGDVYGLNKTQDGQVDGLDFSYIKTQVSQRLSGDNLAADLNGNCQLESQDLALLMFTLKERLEQLY